MFSQFIIPGFITVAVIIVLHLLAKGLKLLKHPRAGRKLGKFEKLTYLATLIAIGILAFSAFIPILTDGYMGGWPLFIHSVIAGAFLLVITLLTILWAEDHTPSCNNAQNADSNSKTNNSPFRCGAKLCFWILQIGCLLAIGSMLATMLPVLSTANQHLMHGIHRYAGLIVVLSGILHAYLVLIGRRDVK